MGGLSNLTSLGLGVTGGAAGSSANSTTGDAFGGGGLGIPSFPTELATWAQNTANNSVNTLPAFSLATQLQATGANSVIVRQALEAQESTALKNISSQNLGFNGSNKALVIASAIVLIALVLKKK